MITLGEIFRRYGPAYRARFGDRMLPSHGVAMQAIEQCRTEALGGHVYTCAACGTIRYSYHSCKNRHCPTCQHQAAQAWLDQQQALLLPVPYFLITFTVPSGLRDVARTHQKTLYTLLFRSSAAALQQLAHDPRFIGGQLGMIGVLQTWTRDLRYHPHVHYLVPAIALTADEQLHRPYNPAFLVPVKPLAILFRAKLRAALRQTALYAQVAPQTWTQAWVVDCRPVGSGTAALKYLAPYSFRVALSNNRIIGVEHDQVTFRYRDGANRQIRTCTLPALTFMQRFLQHVLPKGFVKVRYYGLFRGSNRELLGRLRALLGEAAVVAAAPTVVCCPSAVPATPGVLWCPSCGMPMQQVQLIPRRIRGPPVTG